MIKRIFAITVAAVMRIATTACTSNEKRTVGYGIGGARYLAHFCRSAAGTLVGAAQTRNGV